MANRAEDDRPGDSRAGGDGSADRPRVKARPGGVGTTAPARVPNTCTPGLALRSMQETKFRWPLLETWKRPCEKQSRARSHQQPSRNIAAAPATAKVGQRISSPFSASSRACGTRCYPCPALHSGNRTAPGGTHCAGFPGSCVRGKDYNSQRSLGPGGRRDTFCKRRQEAAHLLLACWR